MRRIASSCSAILLTLISVIPGSASARDSDVLRNMIPSLTVTGTASEILTPDRASLSLVLSAIAPSAPEAVAAAAAESQAVIAAAVSLGVPLTGIKTSSLQVGEPTKREPDASGKQIIVTLPGSRAEQILEITFPDPHLPSIVVPKLMESGAKKITSLHYYASNAEARGQKLQQRAVAAAVAQAKHIVAAAPVKLGRILRIESGYEGKGDLPARGRSLSGSFQLEPGMIPLDSSMIVVFELLPK